MRSSELDGSHPEGHDEPLQLPHAQPGRLLAGLRAIHDKTMMAKNNKDPFMGPGYFLETRVSMAVFALLATLVILAYGNTLQGEIVDGDVYLIAGNSLIKDVRNLPRLFVSDWWAGTEQPLADKRYRPLAVATIMLNYAVAGLNPFGYHLVNLMLHFLVTWTLYQLAIRLGWPLEAALVASAIFAVHPLHLEAVTPISNRTELMMALSVLGSLWLVLGGHSYWAVATFACGLFSKEQAVIFPVLLALYDYSMGNATTSTSSRITRLLILMHRYGGYLIMLGGYLLLRIWLFDGFSPPNIRSF